MTGARSDELPNRNYRRVDASPIGIAALLADRAAVPTQREPCGEQHRGLAFCGGGRSFA